MANELRGIAKKLQALKDRAHVDPLKFYMPTMPQLKWLKDQSRLRLFRAGNQIGKTSVQCFEIACRLRGSHPFRNVPPPPTEIWLVTHSWSQSQVIMAKLFDLIPKNELHPSCIFNPGRGFSGVTPLIRMKNGTICRIRTTSQAKGGKGILGLESASVSYIGIDEPPPKIVWGALAARTLRGGAGVSMGEIGITMTPIGDVQYLKLMVEDGRLSETTAALTVENCTPINPYTGEKLAALITQEAIDEISKSYLSIDSAARISGSWEIGELENRVFDSFSQENISSDPCPKSKDYVFCIGLDHGVLPGTQICVLAAIDMNFDGDKYPRVYLLDEYVSTKGGLPAEAHCREILKMIRRNFLKPEQINYWHGDSVHSGSRVSGRMSNSLLVREFEKICNYPSGCLPWRIRTVRKPGGSVYMGCALINSMISRRHFWVHPKAKTVIHSLLTWQMAHVYHKRGDDPLSHSIDALRYCVVPVLDRGWSKLPSRLRILQNKR